MEEKGTQALGIAFLFRMVKFSNDVEKNVILHEIWGNGFTGSSRVIDTVVKQLRKKLSGSNIQIITHYGRGISAVIQ